MSPSLRFGLSTRYLPHTEADIRAMLDAIGVSKTAEAEAPSEEAAAAEAPEQDSTLPE